MTLSWRKLRSVVALAVITAPFVAGVASGATPAGPSGPVLFRAEFPGPVTELRLQVTPVLTDTEIGEEYGEFSLESARFDQLGNNVVVVRANPEEIPAEFVHPGGIVDFRLIGAGEEGRWETADSARAVSVGSTWQWIDPLRPVPGLDKHERQARSFATGSSLADVSAAAELEDNGITPGSFAPINRGSYCVYHPTTEQYDWWSTIGTAYPVGNSTAYAKFETTREARFGVAWAATGEYFWSLGGSATITSSAGLRWTSAATGEQRSFQAQVHYQRFSLWCSLYAGGPQQYIGGELRPMKFTGGVLAVPGLARPDWNYKCVPVDFGEWSRHFATGKSYSYSAGVKSFFSLGVNMMSERNYSDGSEIVYVVTGPRTKQMCSSDAGIYPPYAGKVIERNR